MFDVSIEGRARLALDISADIFWSSLLSLPFCSGFKYARSVYRTPRAAGASSLCYCPLLVIFDKRQSSLQNKVHGDTISQNNDHEPRTTRCSRVCDMMIR